MNRDLSITALEFINKNTSSLNSLHSTSVQRAMVEIDSEVETRALLVHSIQNPIKIQIKALLNSIKLQSLAGSEECVSNNSRGDTSR